MSFRQLRNRCEAMVRGIEIPDPFSILAMSGTISARRGRPLHLHPSPGALLGPCGMWVATAGSDYVLYDGATSRLHQEHIILHEFGHLLCAHEPAETADVGMIARALGSSLDGELLGRVLKRDRYDEAEEQEAEMVASLLRQRAGRSTAAPDSHALVPLADPPSRAFDALDGWR